MSMLRAGTNRVRSAVSNFMSTPVNTIGVHSPVSFARYVKNRGVVVPSGLDNAVKDKKVLITGASSGIGLHTALLLADAGAEVLLAARRESELQKVADQITAAGGKASVFPADLSNEAGCAALIEQVKAEHGYIDILVNNAGKSIRRSARHSTDRVHDFARTAQLNYLAPVQLILGFLPEMMERNEGQVLNILSAAVFLRPPRFAAYVGSKCALDGASDVFQSEVAHTNIRFTNIYFSLVSTPMIEPNEAWGDTPAISVDTAAAVIAHGIVSRRRRLGSPASFSGGVIDALNPNFYNRVNNSYLRSTKSSAVTVKKESE